jgi:hypothetical protein
MTRPSDTKRQSPRYTIRTSADGRTVSLESAHDDVLAALGEYEADTIRRVYWVRGDRDGYVHDVTRQPGTLGQQVCDRLRHTGNCLSTTRATLATVIRHELRAALRAADVEGR